MKYENFKIPKCKFCENNAKQYIRHNFRKTCCSDECLARLNQEEDRREKISKSMKLAHKEGRAWNIGMSRWNNEPSYPEKFFMKVIENEFDDKEYTREYPCGIYSIDFAWEHKMLAIEIDGEQHMRPEYMKRDKRKDEYLKSMGWTVVRVPWRDFYHNTKDRIKYLKTIID